MADTTRSISESLAACALTLGEECDEYGQPGSDDFVVVLDSVLENLEQFEGTVAMELPATNVKVDRADSGEYNVYLKVGTIEAKE